MLGLFNKRKYGNQFEFFAATELENSGCVIVKKNYNCKLGEIDIIVKEDNILVFVEVRYRKKNTFGGAIASVDLKKQHKIIKAAQLYLQQENLTNQCICRFDVFAIEGQVGKLKYQWIKNAFTA